MLAFVAPRGSPRRAGDGGHTAPRADPRQPPHRVSRRRS